MHAPQETQELSSTSQIEPEAVVKFGHGQAIRVGSGEGVVAVFDEGGRLLGTGAVGAEGTLRPKRLLATH